MIRDSRLLFWDKLDIKGGGVAFGDAIDLQNAGQTGSPGDPAGGDDPLYFCVLITTAGAGGTSMSFELRAGSTAPSAGGVAGAAARTIISTGAIVTASLTAGAFFAYPMPPLPVGQSNQARYLGAGCTKSGTFTALNASAWLSRNAPTLFRTYADARN